MEEWIMAYLAIMNLIGISLMMIDKRRAIRHAWRIHGKNAVFV